MSIDETIRETIHEAVKEAFLEFNPVPKPDRPRTMTIKQAAEYAGISERAMRNLAYRADFGGMIRVGRTLRIVVDKLDQWLDGVNVDSLT